MKGFVFAAAAMTSTPAIAQDAAPLHLDLVCDGGTVTEVVASSTTANVNSAYGRTTGTSETIEPRYVAFSIRVKIEGEAGQVNLPAFALPGLSSAKDGWLRIKNLRVTEDHITGKIPFNFLSNSSFQIDRRAGTISSSGGFSGNCRPDAGERKF